MDMVARMELSVLRGSLARVTEEASGLTNTLSELKFRLNNQSVAIKMLISMFVEKSGASEAEMLKRVFELIADSELSSPPHICPACNRTLSRRRNVCPYCEAERRMESVYELLEH